MYQAQGDVLVERVKRAPALDRFDSLLERPLCALQPGEPVKHLLDTLVPVALLHANPVVEVERIAQGKILEERAAVQGGSTIELGNQSTADLSLHPLDKSGSYRCLQYPQ